MALLRFAPKDSFCIGKTFLHSILPFSPAHFMCILNNDEACYVKSACSFVLECKMLTNIQKLRIQSQLIMY